MNWLSENVHFSGLIALWPNMTRIPNLPLTGRSHHDDMWSETKCPAAALRGRCPPCWLCLTGHIRRAAGPIYHAAATIRGSAGPISTTAAVVCSTGGAKCRRPGRREEGSGRREGADRPVPGGHQVHPQQRLAVPAGLLGDVPARAGSDRQARPEIGAVTAEQARG